MEKIYEELDEAKAEIEKLAGELKRKEELSECLKKSHNKQSNEIQEAKLKIEKLGEELYQKAEETIEVKQMYEDLKCSFYEKESIIKRLCAANDKLRVDCDEKSKIWEDEKRGLVLALNEVNEKARDREQQLHTCREEIESLKGCLTVSKKKWVEADRKVKSFKEVRERDNICMKLEEENRKVEDQLKWKKEQFKHLEEAHGKLGDQFRSSKKEWEVEKALLLDELCSLQMKLDSEIRISADLQSQLKMSNQALSHEESRRKYLEVQVSDFKTQFEHASTEQHDMKLQVDCLISQRDKDIADLRHSMQSKETYYKELEYQNAKLEQENQDLRVSIKELQEAQIQQAVSSTSLSKLRNQLRSLEQMYRNCTLTFKAREAEWSPQLAKLKADLNDYRSLLKSKTEAMDELKVELESSYSLNMQLKLQNEEMAMILMVLNMGIAEAQLKLANDKNELDLCSKEREEEFSQIMKQLEMKNAALFSANTDINKEHVEATCFMRKVESLDFTEEQKLLVQIELDSCKEMLEESNRCQLFLKDKVPQLGSDSPEKLREVSDALERASIELAERICEGNELELELLIWKSIAERLQKDLEENHLVRKELETSLLEQVDVGETSKREKDGLIHMLEEKDKIMDNLQQQVVLLEEELKLRDAEASGPSITISPKSDKLRFLQITREKNKILEKLQKEVAWLEQESIRREFKSAVIAQISKENTLGHEKENLIQLVDGKNLRIADLMQQLKSLEQKFNTSLVSLSSQLAEKQAEIDLVFEAWGKISAAEILAVVEIEEKKLMIEELEGDINDIQHKLKLQEEAWCHSERHVLEVETKLEAKRLEWEDLTKQMGTKLTNSDAMLYKLRIENRNLLEDVTKLSSERENLLSFVVELGDKICECSTSDTLLIDMLGSLVESFETNCPGMELKSDDVFLVKENVNTHSPPATKKFDVISDARSPFRVLN
ncbi:basic helix-loop-helix (bHLH) DNA-binding superfamily protein [Quillaja saponaria]|uniref:Basic helix-loop-helix (BHLH) DNA-binding superfamily protein n=1 Tax=Quillaja saponaria TaxID=32244 RepID=A0AAD7LA09_QUISA|nr:basic helix-loop-helix (bHLH) DNA-binding superfamily protein [Quillaja saponaria]